MKKTNYKKGKETVKVICRWPAYLDTTVGSLKDISYFCIKYYDLCIN
jgi:hypothetical protein